MSRAAATSREHTQPPPPELPFAMPRLPQIEGLRFYLAFWVLLSHVFSPMILAPEHRAWIPRPLQAGGWAVDIFIIISGFVIFYLLAHKQESYLSYLTRRFFRLWPLFILLFAISIPLSLLMAANAANPANTLGPEAGALVIKRVASWWHYAVPNILLHIPLLHGLVPNAVIPDASGAFLGPAWSISLEWQFYLLAPLAFALATSRRTWGPLVLSGLCCLLFLAARRLPGVENGAALPFHVEFFYLGGFSFFLVRTLSRLSLKTPTLPIGIALGLFLFLFAKYDLNFIPLCLWLPFLGVLIDSNCSQRGLLSHGADWIFNNPVAQHLGRISYSIYLAHMPVLILSQALVLWLLPGLGWFPYLLAVLGLTILGTLAASHLLYFFIEVPGIKLGNRIAARFR